MVHGRNAKDRRPSHLYSTGTKNLGLDWGVMFLRCPKYIPSMVYTMQGLVSYLTGTGSIIPVELLRAHCSGDRPMVVVE